MAASETNSHDDAELLHEGVTPLQEFTSPAIYPTPEEAVELGRRLAKLKAEALADPVRAASWTSLIGISARPETK